MTLIPTNLLTFSWSRRELSQPRTGFTGGRQKEGTAERMAAGIRLREGERV